MISPWAIHCLTPLKTSTSGGGMISPCSILCLADLLNRWDDDVVFKNQARGTEDKRKKEFVNVIISLYFYVPTSTH